MMIQYKNSYESARFSALKLLDYCRSNEWSGHDPYDALNSRLLGRLPIVNSRILRITLTQVLRRSPINFRHLLQIPKTQNPKALALFLSASLKLARLGLDHQAEVSATMIEGLRALRSQGESYWCWGYNFPWQTRTIIVPIGAANLVCTTFVANGLLDAFDGSGDRRWLDMASSAAQYILNELYWTEGTDAGFSYPLPSLHSRVHNANFLAAALLCRVFTHTQDERLLACALRVARYSAAKQKRDGSWIYGEAPSQQWIDNFHTGYNLCALREIARHARTNEFDQVLDRGYKFYRRNFFLQDGSVKYFHNCVYPIDIHCIAQSIITLARFKDMDSGNLRLAHSVLAWGLTHLWDNRGFFYYRKSRFFTNRISYMRWSQAWMLFSLATLLETSNAQLTSDESMFHLAHAGNSHD